MWTVFVAVQGYSFWLRRGPLPLPSFLDRLLAGNRPGEGVSQLGVHRGDCWQVPGRVIAQVIVGRRDLW